MRFCKEMIDLFNKTHENSPGLCPGRVRSSAFFFFFLIVSASRSSPGLVSCSWTVSLQRCSSRCILMGILTPLVLGFAWSLCCHEYSSCDKTIVVRSALWRSCKSAFCDLGGHFWSILGSLLHPGGHFWSTLGILFVFKSDRGVQSAPKAASPEIPSPFWTPFGTPFSHILAFFD